MSRGLLSWRWRRPAKPTSTDPAPRQLLVDVSNFVRADARTGIQRVVRGLLREIARQAPEGFVVRPVHARRHHGYRYVGADSAAAQIAGAENASMAGKRVVVSPGDLFLGLDLAANILPYRQRQLAGWRRRGVRFHFVVYDLLPLTDSHWFEAKTVRNFRRWFDALPRLADTLLCISGTVRDDLARLGAAAQTAMPATAVVPLGSDLAGSVPSSGLPDDVEALFAWLYAHRVALIVGTLEPRKGHQQVLAAFDEIWASPDGEDVALLFVGKSGWRTEDFQRGLVGHPEFGRRLRWLPAASDELLGHLYRRSAGTICASRGEGFGLPIIEALEQGSKVLARDLPIFREISGDRIDYFQDRDAPPLSSQILTWLDKKAADYVRPFPRWEDSGQAVWQAMKAADVRRSS